MTKRHVFLPLVLVAVLAASACQEEPERPVQDEATGVCDGVNEAHPLMECDIDIPDLKIPKPRSPGLPKAPHASKPKPKAPAPARPARRR